MFKKILLVIAVLAAVFAGIVAKQPSQFRVERAAAVAAPPPLVFEQVNDLRKWQAWSPWAKMDPNAKITYAGPVAGIGAAFSWAGNNKVGEGRMTVIDSRPNEMVRFQLDFVKPFKATNYAEFTFKPQGDRTDVRWSMTGTNNFLSKAVGLFIDCDKMVGGQFEQGLSQLRAVVEKP